MKSWIQTPIEAFRSGAARRSFEGHAATLRSPSALMCALLTLSACEAGRPLTVPDRPVAVSEQRIIDGERDSGSDAAVVAIVVQSANTLSLCSGSVIGPFHVMTAKHCVFDDAGKAVPPSGFEIAIGDDLTRRAGVTAVAKVSNVKTTPGSDIETDVRNGDDIAILVTQTRLSPTPLPIAKSIPAIGSVTTIIGFGRTMPGVAKASDAGVKFIGMTAVKDFDSHLIATVGDSATCEGDSGGPLLDSSGAVVGITSFGLDATCESSTSVFTLTTRHADFIASVLGMSPDCTGAKPEVCNGADDNCNGVIDEGCKKLGDTCTKNVECAGGLCSSVDGRMLCTLECDPSRSLSDCPSGTYCSALGCGTGHCVAGAPGNHADGEVCKADSDCTSGNCGSVDGSPLCGRACNTSGDSCSVGEVCDTSDGEGGCGTCVPIAKSRAPRPFAAACDSDVQCASQMCTGAGSTGAFCTRACSMAQPCGGGTHCRDGLCVAGQLGAAGTACVNAMDCSQLAPECVARDGDHVCAGRCKAASDCILGFDCDASDDGGKYCLRSGAALGSACDADAQCASGSCDAGHCVRGCSVTRPCPNGFACEPSTHDATVSVCAASAQKSVHSGGCSVVAGGARSVQQGLLLVMPIAWLLRRRRRIRCER